MKKSFLIFLLLILISLPSIKALLGPGGFTSHDLTHHVLRQVNMEKLLQEGQFPPRWSGDLYKGYGYPLFLFNYPLPPILGEAFRTAGFGYVESVKGVLGASLIVSIIGMYLFLQALLKDRWSAVLGAVFYLYAPIRFINVYVSSAIGNAVGLAFVPFVFWSITKLSQTNSYKWIAIGALSFGGMILSHNVTSVMFFPIMILFSCLLIKQVRDQKRLALSIAAMFTLGFGISAFFWIPSIVEKQYIRYDQLMEGFYKDQFPSLQQLIYSPWGYGLAHPNEVNVGGQSFQIGLAHLLVIGLFIISLWFFRNDQKIIKWGGFAVVCFVGSIFIMLSISRPVWDVVPLLSYTQFPSRFLSVAVFSASLAGALLILKVPYRKLLFFMLLLLVLYANRNHMNINEKFDPGEDYYINLKTSSTAFDEHLPVWAKLQQDDSSAKLIFVTGEGSISTVKDTSVEVVADVETTSSAVLRLNQFYFPGWTIYDNNHMVTIKYQSPEENYGFPIFNIDSGKHTIKAVFNNTSIRAIANTVSVISLLVLLSAPLLLQRKNQITR